MGQLSAVVPIAFRALAQAIVGRRAGLYAVLQATLILLRGPQPRENGLDGCFRADQGDEQQLPFVVRYGIAARRPARLDPAPARTYFQFKAPDFRQRGLRIFRVTFCFDAHSRSPLCEKWPLSKNSLRHRCPTKNTLPSQPNQLS